MQSSTTKPNFLRNSDTEQSKCDKGEIIDSSRFAWGNSVGRWSARKPPGPIFFLCLIKRFPFCVDQTQSVVFQPSYTVELDVMCLMHELDSNKQTSRIGSPHSNSESWIWQKRILVRLEVRIQTQSHILLQLLQTITHASFLWSTFEIIFHLFRKGRQKVCQIRTSSKLPILLEHCDHCIK